MNARKRPPVWVLGPVFLILAALACDDGPPPLTGITCLEKQADGTIVAPDSYASYSSADGGFTWKSNPPLSPDPLKDCAKIYQTHIPPTLPDPTNLSTLYRFNPEISIEKSTDGGQTWNREVDLSGTEARTVYYMSKRYDGANFVSGPVDALFDEKSGNLVVAMGYEGVLVRTPQGRWGWVTVGKYSRADMRDLSITLPLISDQLWMAVFIGIVLAGTLPTLARGINFWLLLGAGIGSGVSVLGLIFVIGLTFSSWQSAPLSWVPGTLVVGIIPGIPIFISWKIAERSRQKDRLAFVWSGLCWTYLGMVLVVFMMAMFNRPGEVMF